jgi:hypothetical protein
MRKCVFSRLSMRNSYTPFLHAFLIGTKFLRNILLLSMRNSYTLLSYTATPVSV